MEQKAICLFCGSANTDKSFYPEVLFNNKIFVYYECRDCKLNFNFPLLNKDDYNTLYPVQYHDEFYFKSEKKFDRQLEILTKCDNIKSFVDYGCGDASLLYFLSQSGFDCVGVEFNEALVSRLKKQYPATRFYTVEEFDELKEKYDCIHLGDVLEHMTDPNGIAKKLTGRLNDNGYLFVEGPLEHNSSLAYSVRKLFFTVRNWINPRRRVEGRPYHTFLANRINQKEMLEKNKLITQYLDLYETAWPFPEKSIDCKSVKAFFEFVVARVSIFISSFFPWMGNRFYYMGKKH